MILLVFMIIGAVICGAVASHKGRNVAGFAILGFFFPLIGVIIVCVLSNRNEEIARDRQITEENRRLREQVRQERIKTEAFRQHAVARLDAHDQHLGLDTRSAGAALASGGDPLAQLVATQQGPDGKTIEWYYDAGGTTQGPTDADNIRFLLESRRINKDTLIWAQHLDAWQPLQTVAEFETDVRQ